MKRLTSVSGFLKGADNMVKTAYCFDLDGTITSQEILPLISREVGLHEEIATLTDITMQGLIPFESSFKLRVKLLNSISIARVQNIVRNVSLQHKIVQFIKSNSQNCYAITGNLDIWIQSLKEKIGCEFYCSSADYTGDQLHGIRHILNKGNTVKILREKYDRIVAVGDGMNDAPMFEQADVRIAYGGVHSPVETLIQLADFVTYREDGLCNILSTL